MVSPALLPVNSQQCRHHQDFNGAKYYSSDLCTVAINGIKSDLARSRTTYGD